MSSISATAVRIDCTDGVPLNGYWFNSRYSAQTCTVIVAPGAAAAGRYYHAFCEFLAKEGFDVLCFDFRSVGESHLGPIRKDRKSSFSSWITRDFPAVIRHAKAKFPNQRLAVIGHSAGGWMSGINPESSKLDGIIGVAALSGYWRHMAKPHRYAHWLAWHLLVPIATRLFGFWPGIIGFSADMPRRFGQEFARWGRHPEFVFSDAKLAAKSHAASFKGKLHLLQMTDDPWGTLEAVEAYSKYFPNAQFNCVESIVPKHHKAVSLGHSGFFRRRHRETLWPLAVNRLYSILSLEARVESDLAAQNPNIAHHGSEWSWTESERRCLGALVESAYRPAAMQTKSGNARDRSESFERTVQQAREPQCT